MVHKIKKGLERVKVAPQLQHTFISYGKGRDMTFYLKVCPKVCVNDHVQMCKCNEIIWTLSSSMYKWQLYCSKFKRQSSKKGRKNHNFKKISDMDNPTFHPISFGSACGYFEYSCCTPSRLHHKNINQVQHFKIVTLLLCLVELRVFCRNQPKRKSGIIFLQKNSTKFLHFKKSKMSLGNIIKQFAYIIKWP